MKFSNMQDKALILDLQVNMNCMMVFYSLKLFVFLNGSSNNTSLGSYVSEDEDT